MSIPLVQKRLRTPITPTFNGTRKTRPNLFKEGTLKEEGKNETVEGPSLRQLTLLIPAKAVSVTLLLLSSKVVAASIQERSSPKTGTSR